MQKPACLSAITLLVLVSLSRLSYAQQRSAPATILTETAQRLQQGKPIERELKAGETHVYQLSLRKGQFLKAAVNQRGIDVIVRVFSPNKSKVAQIDSPNGDKGDEPVRLEAPTDGVYRIEVSSLEKEVKPGRYEIRLDEVMSASAYAAWVADSLRGQQSIISWLKTHAIPIKTVEAGNGFADLQPLKEVFKEVRFVGLGEATHGTREFFQVKHRLLEFLVRQMGFRVFALEGSYAALQVINDYVMGRLDDGTKALDGQGFWTWNTEEVRTMLDWARRYNQEVPADQRVRFVGFDIQFNQPGKERLLDYLKRVAPERVATTEAFFKANLDSLNSGLSSPQQKLAAMAKLKDLQTSYTNLFVFLELNGARLTAKSSQSEYEQMREFARVLVQYIDAYSQPNGWIARDQYMADNFRRLVEREPAGTRFVLWAHNSHIAADTTNPDYPSIGSYLRRFYGSEYYALGFSFNQGSFQAREAQPKDSTRRMLLAFTANPAPARSVDWFLTQTGARTFVVDIRPPSDHADLGKWLTTPHPMRDIGSVYEASAEPYFFAPTILQRRYDGLLFIDTTTRARPNPSVKNVAGRDDK